MDGTRCADVRIGRDDTRSGLPVSLAAIAELTTPPVGHEDRPGAGQSVSFKTS